jgi:hypothetical protein
VLAATGAHLGALASADLAARCREGRLDAQAKAASRRERKQALTADGEAAARLGNLTIRWHPDEGWLEIKLPAPLAHLANAPRGRYRLESPVSFPYRSDEVAAQACGGAVRYDISCDPRRDRWYLDASWRIPDRPAPMLEEIRATPVLAVDLNHGHLDTWVVTPVGTPARPGDRRPFADARRAPTNAQWIGTVV